MEEEVVPELRLIGKVYYSDIYIAGKRVRKPLDTDKRFALKKLSEMIDQSEAIKYGRALPTDSSLDSLKERFLKIYGSRSKITRRHYVRAIGHLEVSLPGSDIHQATPSFLADLYLKWKGIRGLYVRNRDMECILTFLRRLERWGILPGQDWEEVLRVMDEEPRGRVDFFSIQELKILKKKIYGMWLTMTYLGARAGLRPGEMLYLEWRDVDWEYGKLHIDSKPKLNFFVKKHERRTIPMPKDLKAYLWSLYKRRKSDFVVANENGERPASVDVMSTYYSRLVRKAGLKGHLYKLRHSYGSHLAQAGVLLQVTRDLMGHRNISTTEIYAHLIPEMHQAAVNRLPSW